ncbi:hypothetical protein TNCV_3406871 [Trichonephila clavipes]|nr:hypothetical protein TNCV_3406871 [Trichonephila clavipes]
MSALKRVDVSFNYLYSLLEDPWKSVWWQLQFIDITNNFIECDCNLLWLVNPSNVPEKLTLKRKIQGHCSRSLSSLFVQHFDLESLTMEKLDCDTEDDEIDDYDYLDRIVVKDRKKTKMPDYFTTPNYSTTRNDSTTRNINTPQNYFTSPRRRIRRSVF